MKRRRMPRPGDTPRWRSGMRISCKEFPARAMAGFEVPICQARSSGISGRFCQALFRRVWPRPHSALNGRSPALCGRGCCWARNPNFQPGAHSARREFLLRHRCALPGGRRRGLCRGHSILGGGRQESCRGGDSEVSAMKRVVIDEKKCTKCGACAQRCPFGALKKREWKAAACAGKMRAGVRGLLALLPGGSDFL